MFTIEQFCLPYHDFSIELTSRYHGQICLMRLDPQVHIIYIVPVFDL